jgi:hypothetical protein
MEEMLIHPVVVDQIMQLAVVAALVLLEQTVHLRLVVLVVQEQHLQ